MQTIITYFESIPSWHRGLILAGGITFFWLIESSKPLFKFGYQKWNHAFLNFFFTVTTIVVNFTMAFLLLITSNWVITHEFGLLFWIPISNIYLYTLAGLLVLDLIGAYAAHWVQHRVKWMWRFHLIHHTDTWVDTTTANRHHPGESIIRFVFTMLATWLVGAPMWMVFLYQSLSVVFSQFNHANMSFSNQVDRYLSYFIISPNMHKVHHHYQLPYTDTNYGNIFSIWDRLFGTFSYLKKEDIVFGVDTHMIENENNNLKNLLKIPFQPSRKPTNS
jgi:sterol desaturase/sphingolipid hydroxylase (fatty acid hydroxylase superfamily)